MTNNEKLFKQKVEKLTKVYVAKNKDYGDSFSQSLDKYGILASLIRMGDKVNRIDSLYDKPTTEVDESLVDSLEDLANYAIMTAIWLEKQVEDMGSHVRHWDDDDFDDDYDDLFDDDIDDYAMEHGLTGLFGDDHYDDNKGIHIDHFNHRFGDNGEVEEFTFFISGSPTHTLRNYPDGRTEIIVNNIEEWEYIGENKGNSEDNESEDDTDDFSMDGEPKSRIVRRPRGAMGSKDFINYLDLIRYLYDEEGG